MPQQNINYKTNLIFEIQYQQALEFHNLGAPSVDYILTLHCGIAGSVLLVLMLYPTCPRSFVPIANFCFGGANKMLKEFNILKSTTVRIWVGSVPLNAKYAGEQTQFELTSKPSTSFFDANYYAVEINRYVGPTFQYALLGGKWVWNAREIFLVRLQTSDSMSKPYHDAISMEKDSTFAGLPAEYLNSIKNGMTSYSKKQIVSSGTLDINYGAHNLIGSSPVMFEKIGYALLGLTQARNLNDINQELLESLLS